MEEETQTPPRSSEYVFSSAIALSIGAIDLLLLAQYTTIFGSLVQPLTVLIIIATALSIIPVIANFRVRYTLTEDSLIVRKAIGSNTVPLQDIESAYPHRLSHHQHFLLNLNPAHTIRDGVMIEKTDGKRLFISPRNREEFITKIEARRPPPQAQAGERPPPRYYIHRTPHIEIRTAAEGW